MLKGFDEREGEGRRDLVFLPVGLNYDRVLEDRTQLLKTQPEAPRPGRVRALRTLALVLGLAAGAGAARAVAPLRLRLRELRRPVSMRTWCREGRA